MTGVDKGNDEIRISEGFEDIPKWYGVKFAQKDSVLLGNVICQIVFLLV